MRTGMALVDGCWSDVTCLPSASREKLEAMSKWKQFELWVQTAESKWEMVGVFPDPVLPAAVARARSGRARLIEVLYDGSKLLGQEVIAEMGMPGQAE